MVADTQNPEDDSVIEYDFGETGLYDIADVNRLLNRVFDENPDNIKISTYRQMMRDSQVRAGVYLIKLALMSQPASVKFPDDFEDTRKEDIIKFLNYNLDHVNTITEYSGGLRGAMDEMLDAPFLGFGVTEPVYYRIDKGEWAGKIGLQKLKPLPPDSILFRTDTKGNLLELLQNFTDFNSGGDGSNYHKLTPLGKFLIWSFEKKDGNLYGEGMLKSAYKHWWIKEFLIKKWNLFLERKAVPLLIGYTRTGNIRNLNKLLSSTNEKTAITVSSEDRIEMPAVKTDAAKQFEDAIKYHDAMIFRAFLTPILLIAQEDVGARALADTQKETYMWTINKVKEDFSALINVLLSTLVNLNFPDVGIMPKYYIPELSKADKSVFIGQVKELTQLGYLDPVTDNDWVRAEGGFPKASPDAEIGVAKPINNFADTEDIDPEKDDEGNPKAGLTEPDEEKFNDDDN